MVTVYYAGKFSRSYSTENYVTHALEQEGVNVIKEHVSHFDLKRVLEIRPDFVLTAKAPIPDARTVMRILKAEGIPTACWQWDLWWGCRGGHLMPHHFRSDYLFTTDGGHPGHWKIYNHHLLRQGIHEPEAKLFPSRRFTHDVAFVGSRNGHSSRGTLLSWLKETYKGRFVHHTRTRGLRLNRMLTRVKVVVGDTWPCPNYWSNRIYEITGRGGMLLFPSTEGLDAEYTEGKHYVGYKRGNFDQLYAKIESLLQDDERREEIRQAGFKHTREHYTYQHRVRELLATVSASKTVMAPTV